ncbi:MAG TPA: tail fiber domain-containing protein [Armatimonadota bacterium]
MIVSFARAAAFAGLLGCAARFAPAQAPRTITFQGRLTNAAGAALPDGPQNVIFRLYNGREGALAVTHELQTFSGATVTLAHSPVVANSETVAKADGTSTYTRGGAYTIDDATGVITRVSAAAIPDGTQVKVDYQYTAAKLWEEMKAVQVRGGLVSTALGDATAFPATLSFAQPLYLGMQVGADPEMTPRTALANAPSALALALPYADTADIPNPGAVVSVTNLGNGNVIHAVQAPSTLFDPYQGIPAAVWGSSQWTGVLGTGANVGVWGLGIDGPGVYGETSAAGGGHHAAAVEGRSTADSGVAVFAGDKEPYGIAGIQTNFLLPATHIWCAENDNQVFAVTAGGAVCGLSFNQCSDVRFKQRIETLQDPLNAITALRGVSFEWNPKGAGRAFPSGKQIGFVAQEVEKVLPQVVHTDQDGTKSVAYQNVVPVLVEAIKAQQKEIADLRRQVAGLTALEGPLKQRQMGAADHGAPRGGALTSERRGS